MIHHKCQVPHRPQEGKFGDCLRACIASILNINDASSVPHFLEDGNDELCDDRLRDYLKQHKLDIVFTGMGSITKLDDILTATGSVNPNIGFLLFCNNGDGDHCIIIKNGKVAHDPSWFGSGKNYRPLDQNGMWVLGCLTPILE